jgi:predicted nucleic-acid-binding Zn-ribbon protein
MDERGAGSNPIACLRCKQQLQHAGTRRFHEGTNWGAFGEIGELFVKRERFDVYVCDRCGHVEFFVDGLGEQYRPA